MSLSQYLSGLVSSVHKLWLNHQKNGAATQGFAARMDAGGTQADQTGTTRDQFAKGITPAQTSTPTETAQVGLVVESALNGLLTASQKGGATHPKSRVAPVTVPVDLVANRSTTPRNGPQQDSPSPESPVSDRFHSGSTAQNNALVGLTDDLQQKTISLRALNGYQSLNVKGPVWSIGGDNDTSAPRSGGGTQIFDANGLVSTHLAMSF